MGCITSSTSGDVCGDVMSLYDFCCWAGSEVVRRHDGHFCSALDLIVAYGYFGYLKRRHCRNREECIRTADKNAHGISKSS